MALPGGFFYVNSGLVLAADEEAELAGVMAHETAHVCAHHAAREQTRANYAQIGTIPRCSRSVGPGMEFTRPRPGVPLTFLQFSREFEAQADYLGVEYMYRAGYDPQAFVTFFEKIQNLEKRKPGMVAKAFSDHPQTPDRIEHSQEEIAKILPPTRRVCGHDVGVRRCEGAAGAYREQAQAARRAKREEAITAARQHIA